MGSRGPGVHGVGSSTLTSHPEPVIFAALELGTQEMGAARRAEDHP